MSEAVDQLRLVSKRDDPDLESDAFAPTGDADASDDGPRVPRFRKSVWIGALVALVAVAASAWWVGSTTQSPDQAAARAEEPDASWVTARVEFRVLASTLVARGDVRAEARTDVRSPVSIEGDAVVTQTPVSLGDVVEEGDRVIEVSGRPVFVLQGQSAIYRSLQPGMTGDDVSDLQASLGRLGYAIDAAEIGTYGATTAIAVSEFYAAAGYVPVPTSATYSADLALAERAATDAAAVLTSASAAFDAGQSATLGSVIAQADENVAAAQRALAAAESNVVTDVAAARTTLDVTLASRTVIHSSPDVTTDQWNAANLAATAAEVALNDAIRDTADAMHAAKATLGIATLARNELDMPSTATTELQSAIDVATGAYDDAVAALSELNRVNGPTIPQGEVVFVAATPSRVVSTSSTFLSSDTGADSSGAAASSSTLLSLASGDLLVAARVRPDEVALITPGLEAEILDELTNTVYLGEVSAVADEATTGADGQLSHIVTITPVDPLPDRLTGSNLRVTMTAATTDREQLVVPLAAVSSGADGSERVSLVDPATGDPIDIAVSAGLSADGFVAIEPIAPSALTVADSVIVGR